MKFKILIYSIIVVISCVAAYDANYAMVYRITATLLSWIAVTFSIGYVGYILFTDKGWHKLNKYLLLVWAGPMIYSLNKWMFIPVLIIIYGGEKIAALLANGKQENQTGLRSRLAFVLPDFAGVAFTFLLLDSIREYTVWKVVIINPFIFGTFLFTIFLFLYFRFLSKRQQMG